MMERKAKVGRIEGKKKKKTKIPIVGEKAQGHGPLAQTVQTIHLSNSIDIIQVSFALPEAKMQSHV